MTPPGLRALGKDCRTPDLGAGDGLSYPVAVAREPLLDWLTAIRWADGFCCPRCGCREGWRTRRDLWVCRDGRHHVSLTAGTLLHGVRDPARFLLAAWWFCSHVGVRPDGMRRAFAPMSYKTAWAWCRRIRTLMRRANRGFLQSHIEVAMIEVPYPVVILATRAPAGRIGVVRLATAREVSHDIILSVIRATVARGSYVVTPAGTDFGRLQEIGYRGRALSQGVPALAQGVGKPLMRFLSCLARDPVTPREFALYLAEFAFRFNRRDDPAWQMVRALVSAAFRRAPQPQYLVPVEQTG